MKDPLFERILINGLEVKNRIYMPAMHLGMALDFQVTDQIVDFYAERARGGAGMICVGFATVDEMSGNSQNIGAHRDAHVPGLARLAEAISSHGARSAVQLNHAGRYNMSFFLNGRQPVAPSAVASKLTRETPRELELGEIEQIIEAFARAAGRVKTAGFDAVEILSGTGYLISEFLSPLTNHRSDRYGGSLENRMRFALEVVTAVRSAVGKAYPLLVRMNGNDFMPGGQGRAELLQVALALEKCGVDAICVNVGWHEARVPQIVASVPRGVFAYLARGIREAVDLPVIASHRINDPVVARRLISDHLCDMVAMGRSLIADPYLPQKAQSGRESDIVHCIACAQGCFDHLFELKHVECMCNPRAGHEGEVAAPKAAVAKRVMVVGGGPAGMSAAVAAIERGHRVRLYEKSDVLGGQLRLAAAPPGREEFLSLAQDLENQLRSRQVEVVLHRPVDLSLVEKEAPDAVILATGAVAMAPPIPGCNRPHVVQAWDVLAGRASVGQRVVIIGGGAVGVETALFLAEKGTLPAEAVKFLLVNQAEDPEVLRELCLKGTKQIAIVEMIDKIGRDIGRSTRWGMVQDLSRFSVSSATGIKALDITATGVRVEGPGGISEIAADTVVVAAGAVSYNPLQEALDKKGISCCVVGDAAAIGRAFDAVHQGAAAGRRI